MAFLISKFTISITHFMPVKLWAKRIYSVSTRKKGWEFYVRNGFLAQQVE